jgi:hypothetical protein
MTKTQKAKIVRQLADIRPGVNYPGQVMVSETVDGKRLNVRFLLQSYYVGMYCAIHVNGASMPHQTGDHDNKKLVRGLVNNLQMALERGADVTIGPLHPCKLNANDI